MHEWMVLVFRDDNAYRAIRCTTEEQVNNVKDYYTGMKGIKSIRVLHRLRQ